MRRLVCLFLMLLLPLHSFAMQGGWYSPGNSFDIAHEIDHLVGASHHHDDDHGAIHYDKSGDSAKHFAEHSAGQHCVMLPSAILPKLAIAPFKLAVLEIRHYIPDHIPERPQRPPQTFG